MRAIEEMAQRQVGRNRRAAPSMSFIGGHGDQFHGYAVGIDQGQQILAEALDALS